jgi:3-oxoacyl-[acyl-carrier-protein] synthase-1
LTAEATAAAVRAGVTEVAEHPFLVDRVAEPIRMARDSCLDAALLGPDRLIEMGDAALEEICSHLERLRSHAPRVALYLALPEERPGWSRESVRLVRQGLDRRRITNKFESIEIVVEGHAAGLSALHVACARVRAGLVDICVIAGFDSYLALETLKWLERNRQLATSYHRGAFIPGEGAGAFAIARETSIERASGQSFAVVRGVGVALETNRIKTEAVCVGEGLTESVRTAIASIQPPKEIVDGIICDINGERYRVEEWTFALLRLPGAFADPTAYEAPASFWGDVGAASGPLFVVLAAMAGNRGWARGPRYLVWNSSEGGKRAAALLELPPLIEDTHLER